MSKKIVISFPGGRGYEIPLLYFGAKHFEDLGFEKVFINHPIGCEEKFEAIYENATKVIQSMDFGEYEEIVFIAKSLGTIVACRIKEMYNIPASLILFTPLEGTLPYINGNNDIRLVAAAEQDRHLDTNRLKELCEKENVNYYIESNVGHRMEVMNDLERNLDIISNVLEQLK